ncbi:carboxymuconolactone decarboxylase family protein, partial [Chloroflexota bacterium]
LMEKGRQVSEKLWGEGTRHKGYSDVFPDFWDMHQAHLYGEVFSRPGLPLRERIMVNLTCLFFHEYDTGIKNTMLWALNNGISEDEIEEIVIHIAHYAGWPCGANARGVAREFFAERKKS